MMPMNRSALPLLPRSTLAVVRLQTDAAVLADVALLESVMREFRRRAAAAPRVLVAARSSGWVTSMKVVSRSRRASSREVAKLLVRLLEADRRDPRPQCRRRPGRRWRATRSSLARNACSALRRRRDVVEHHDGAADVHPWSRGSARRCLRSPLRRHRGRSAPCDWRARRSVRSRAPC